MAAEKPTWEDVFCPDGVKITEGAPFTSRQAKVLNSALGDFMCNEVCGQNGENCLARKLNEKAAAAAFSEMLTEVAESIKPS
jgi:hypothetical protein